MNEEKKTTTEKTKPAVEESNANQIDQIQELLLNPAPAVEETKVVETPAAAPVETEKPVVKVVEEVKVEKEIEKVEGKPAVETPAVEPEKKVEETKAEETKTVEETPAVETDAHWRNQINEMAKKAQGIVPEEKKVETETKPKVEETKALEVQTVQTPAAKVVITKDEFDSAMESEEGLQKVLEKISESKAQAIVEGRLTEILKAIPKVITDTVDERVTIQLAASDFYRDNEDLIPFKAVVAMEADKVFSANPGIDLEEGFNKTGEEVRKKLKMDKGAVTTQPNVKTGGKPAFVNKTSTRTIQQPVVTGIKAEIAETFDIN